MINISSYIRKTTLKEKDYSDIQFLPYEDQIEIFKERSLKLYKLKDIELNPERYKQSEITKAKTNIQNVYKTRSRENKEYELKKIEEAERMKETRQKLRVRK